MDEILTPRLRLRPFNDADLPLYAAICADPEVMRYLGGPMSTEQTAASVRGASRNYLATGAGKIAVERREDGAFLGMCGLSREVWYPDDLEVGWRLAPQHWGQGYATEAARAWIDYAFRVLEAPRVISIADVPNVRSIAVMQRLGMVLDHEAELADGDDRFAAVIYRLDREAWRAV
jgi:RimJ/RimL family protein N-acetyltransferase